MSPIVTDVERVLNHSPPRSPRSARAFQRVGIPTLTVVTVLSSTVFDLARPAAGDAIADAKAKAAAIDAQLSQAQNEMSALSQQYDTARYHLSQINANIDTTKANIASDQAQVAHDKATLSKAAVANYISDGSAAAQNPIFSGNEQTLGATTVYNKITQGDAACRRQPAYGRECAGQAQVAQLQGEQTQAQAQVTAEQNAVAQNAQAVQQQKSTLGTGTGSDRAIGPAAATGRGRSRSRGRPAPAGRRSRRPAPAGRRSRGVTSRRAVRLGRQRRQPGRSHPGGTASDRPGRRGRRAGGREPDRRPLRLGRRKPEGLRQPRVRLLRAHGLVVGPGRGRPAALLGELQMADWTAAPRFSDLQPGDLPLLRPGRPDHGNVHRRRSDDRGALHRGLGLGQRLAPGQRLRRRGPTP